MRVSLRWLEEYVAVNLPAAELAHKLTMAGIEVAQVIHIGDFWQNTFVGKVVDLNRHPNADRLQLVTVDYGQPEQPTFVTGAMNIAVGDKVPVALLGAVLDDAYSDRPQRIELKPVVLRGVRSEGMVCSARELGLGDDHEGIMILDADAPLGAPLQDYLGDTILELDLKPNRSDCLAMLNVAREVAALTGERLRQPATQRIDLPNQPVVARGHQGAETLRPVRRRRCNGSHHRPFAALDARTVGGGGHAPHQQHRGYYQLCNAGVRPAAPRVRLR